MFGSLVVLRGLVRWVRAVVFVDSSMLGRHFHFRSCCQMGQRRKYPSATYARSTPTSVNQSSHTSSFSFRTPNPTAYFVPNSLNTCRNLSSDVFEAGER